MGIIRFLLALSVLIVHSSPIFGVTLLPGYLSVRCFYIISGFYMAMVYNEKYAVTQRPLYNFYTNRAYRLYPLYLLVVIMTIGLGVINGLTLGDFGSLQFYWNKYSSQPNSLGSLALILLTNFTLVGQDWLSFFSITSSGGLSFNGFSGEVTLQEFLFVPIAWTVSIELFFYALVPFISKRSLLQLVGFIVCILFVRVIIYLYIETSYDISIYRLAPVELFWFFLGFVSYKIKILQSNFLKEKSVWLFSFVILCFLFYPVYTSDFVIIMAIVLFTPVIFNRFSKSKIDRYIGELTYPLYIGHCLFLLIVRANRFPKIYGPGPFLFLFTLIFSIIVYHFFQKPIDTWRAKRLGKELL